MPKVRIAFSVVTKREFVRPSATSQQFRTVSWPVTERLVKPASLSETQPSLSAVAATHAIIQRTHSLIPTALQTFRTASQKATTPQHSAALPVQSHSEPHARFLRPTPITVSVELFVQTRTASLHSKTLPIQQALASVPRHAVLLVRLISVVQEWSVASTSLRSALEQASVRASEPTWPTQLQTLLVLKQARHVVLTRSALLAMPVIHASACVKLATQRTVVAIQEHALTCLAAFPSVFADKT